MLYPVLTASRMVSDLSGIWDFKLDDGKGFTEEWYRRPLEDATTMPVPASYNDLKEGISFRDHYGWVFYQRMISVPAYVRNTQRVVLRCDAVTHHARVYLNGEMICEHRKKKPMETTFDLVAAVDAAIPKAVRRKEDGHPARKTFQAVRWTMSSTTPPCRSAGRRT